MFAIVLQQFHIFWVWISDWLGGSQHFELYCMAKAIKLSRPTFTFKILKNPKKAQFILFGIKVTVQVHFFFLILLAWLNHSLVYILKDCFLGWVGSHVVCNIA